MRLVYELAFARALSWSLALCPTFHNPLLAGGTHLWLLLVPQQSTRASPLTRAAQRDQEAQKRAWLQQDLRSDRQARICIVDKLLTHSSVLLEGKPTKSGKTFATWGESAEKGMGHTSSADT